MLENREMKAIYGGSGGSGSEAEGVLRCNNGRFFEVSSYVINQLIFVQLSTGHYGLFEAMKLFVYLC